MPPTPDGDQRSADPVATDAPARTALLLVDVIASFFTEGAANYYADAPAVLDPIAQLLETARSRDRLVVHAVERHHPGLDDFEHRKLPRHCETGGEDAEYVAGFAPDPSRSEVQVGKRRYSAFYATDLDLLLREQHIERLVVVGVKTNVCIRASIQDAFAAGYDVWLPREATNSNRPHLAAASLEDVDRYFGRVVSLSEALEGL